MKPAGELKPLPHNRETRQDDTLTNTDRVEQIRAAVADGTYKVDAAKLSKVLVEKHIKAKSS